MMSLAHQPRLREFSRNLRVCALALASLLVDALVIAGWCAILAVCWQFAPVALPPRDIGGWVLLLSAVLLALATLVIVARYLWWDLRTLAQRFRGDARRQGGSTSGQPPATSGAPAGGEGRTAAAPRLRDLARSRDVLPLERPLRQAARVLAARAGLLVAVALATLLLAAVLLVFLWLGRLVVANPGAAVLIVTAVVLFALVARELRALRRLLGADAREAEVLLARQVPDLQRAQLHLLGELKAESRRLVEAREHLAIFGTPEARLLVDRVGEAAARIAGVSQEITQAAGHAEETMRRFDRRAQEANRVAQALVAALADHVSNFDHAAGAMTAATQEMATALAAGQVHLADGAASNGHRAMARPEVNRGGSANGTRPSSGSEPARGTLPAPDQVAVRHDLGKLLARRFQESGDLGHAVEAVQQFEQALALCPDHAPGRASLRHDLGNIYRAIYERTGDEEYAQAAQQLLVDLLDET